MLMSAKTPAWFRNVVTVLGQLRALDQDQENRSGCSHCWSKTVTRFLARYEPCLLKIEYLFA